MGQARKARMNTKSIIRVGRTRKFISYCSQSPLTGNCNTEPSICLLLWYCHELHILFVSCFSSSVCSPNLSVVPEKHGCSTQIVWSEAFCKGASCKGASCKGASCKGASCKGASCKGA